MSTWSLYLSRAISHTLPPKLPSLRRSSVLRLATCSCPRGFDAKRDIAGIVLNRWGRAYLSPQPGFFFGKDGNPAPRETLRSAPFARIAFANTDLAGAMDHRYSILEAQRAVNQLLDQVLRS